MGYNLYIGEAHASVYMEDRYARIDVEGLELPDAPKNSSDDQFNRIFPSYSVWGDFCRDVGLEMVFYAGRSPCPSGVWWKDDEGKDHDGLIVNHPGAAKLTEAHYRAFVAAQTAYCGRGGHEECNLKRLNWLIWWTRWALDNCEHPTFYNS